MKKLHLKYTSDPSHGWLHVKRTLVEALGIADYISRCSYQRGGMVYLEEDVDAPRFLKAADRAGWTIDGILEAQQDKRSRIRSYDPYEPT